MRAIISTAVLFLALSGGTTFAETAVPAPHGFSDCRGGDIYDAAAKTCIRPAS